jgi:hypothetical protein
MDDGTASLKLAYDVASYFELTPKKARDIAREAGNAVKSWRKEAERAGLSSQENRADEVGLRTRGFEVGPGRSLITGPSTRAPGLFPLT